MALQTTDRDAVTNARICRAIALLAFLVVFPSDARLQERSVSTLTAPTYPNSSEGLKQLLEYIRIAAKENNERRVTAFLKAMEVPNCDTWLHKMYEADKADSWMSLCDAKTLASREKFMRERFVDIAGEDGEILTRKVNDNLNPGRGLEWGWLQAIRQPLDIYFASWKTTESWTEPLGYFIFVDGDFRWYSLVQYPVPAKLLKKVEPVYPAGVTSQRVATVRVKFVIGDDGSVHNARAIPGEGYSEDASLVKAAEEAVMQRRYQPSTFNGRAIATSATIDVTFSPKN